MCFVLLKFNNLEIRQYQKVANNIVIKMQMRVQLILMRT